MKNLILAAAIAFSAVSASATSLIQPQELSFSAMGLSYQIDSALEMPSVHGVYIELNTTKKNITLTFDHNRPCPADRMCPMMMMMPTTITLPIVSKRRDSCNSIVYTAKRDNRMVDGILQQIELTNNQTMTCKTFVAVPATEVVYITEGYNRMNRQYLTTRSTIQATSLNMMATTLPVILDSVK